ncbi:MULTISPECIES: hypothetical protein [unclassified Microbacterium]|uniref:hypothetical protein n=1 Tax=unclassified Microbacterium TaxID=2609290 RepID=UPI0012FD3649|nr:MULTISPECIES: hypothetical protein [unclassified Microbacterium]
MRNPVAAIANHYTCPDCLNDGHLTQLDTGVWVLTVLHDPTCPFLAQRKQAQNGARS